MFQLKATGLRAAVDQGIVVSTSLAVSRVRCAHQCGRKLSKGTHHSSNLLVSNVGIERLLTRAAPRTQRRGHRTSLVAAALTFEESELIPVNGGNIPDGAGVYAVFNKEGECEYVGLSRKVSASIAQHIQDLPEKTVAVKVGLVENPTKDNLTEAWRAWITEAANAFGKVPPGNVTGNNEWKQKRAAARPEIKLTPGKGIEDLTCKVEDLIDSVVKDLKVVAFVKGTRFQPQCGFSHKVLTILNEVGADYDVVNVLDEVYNPGLREAIKAYSQWPTIPQVYINGEFVGGADIVEQLHTSGDLKELLAKVKVPAS
eukprot:jgi/Botrbrau1/4114/Bobra.152_3s0061.1